ncbi:stage II sporulation protein E [Natroniella acetigena]|uniref:stage II sporulation protein E n=1 Tax=Natroniella acetigena TaxID=52004 RepID=UPI00200A3A39|nr:stage II sporulation protein E [Natroniella acetigena]
MKSLDLPIYQRQDSSQEKRKANFILEDKTSIINFTLAVIGFLLGRAIILNDLMPFGISYLAIFFYQWQKEELALKKLIFVLCGVSFGYISQLGWGGLKYILSILLLLFSNHCFSKKFQSGVLFYTFLVGMSYILVRVPNLIFDFSLPIVVNFSSEVLLISLITLLVLRLTPNLLSVVERENKLVVTSLLVVGLIFGLFVSDLFIQQIGNINLARIIASYSIMLTALIAGVKVATVIGVLIGFVYSISYLELAPLIGNYALAGLVAGNFQKQNKLGVISGFLLSSIIYTLFITEVGYIIALTQEGLIAGFILLITPKSLVTSFEELINKQKRARKLKNKKSETFFKERINNFSDIFAELAQTFSSIEMAQNKLEENNLDNLGVFLDIITDKVCKQCGLYNSCWHDSFYKTYNSLFDLLILGENKGELLVDDLREQMKTDCIRKIKLVTEINQFMKMHELNSYWKDKIKGREELLLKQLTGMSDVVEQLTKKLTIKVEEDEQLENNIFSLLKDNGFSVTEVLTTNYNDEELEITITKQSCNGSQQCSKQITPLLNNRLDYNLSLGWSECGYQIDKPNCTCQFMPNNKYDFQGGVATSSQQEGVSGDNYTFFKRKDGSFFAILSDGMGIGSKAYQQSRSAISLLDKMLTAGLSYDVALESVNSILEIRTQQDTFATIDLLNIDQVTGEAEFVKVGSASSFIKRDSDISMVKSTSLPVGILNQVEVEPTSLQLQDGDLIIMLTDGVLDARRNLTIKEEWVLKVLKNNLIDDPHSLAQYILDKAKVENEEIKDDMTVLVIKVNEC